MPVSAADTAVTTTEKTTTYSGVVSEVNPTTSTIILKSETAPAPVTYNFTKETVFVDAQGDVVSYETIRNSPVTVEYISDPGDGEARQPKAPGVRHEIRVRKLDASGGVAVNYHTLSDFRVDHGQALDELLTQALAVLLERKLIELNRVAQDGLRVRASAGSGSFRRKKKLKQYLKEARVA